MNAMTRRTTLILIVAIIALFASAWVSHMQMLFAPISFGDEGFVTQSAYRIYQGQLPYRDFLTGLTPGVFYWVASFMSLFGPTFFAGRLATLIVAIAILALCCLILYRSQVRNAIPYLFLASFLAYFVGPYWFIPSHHWLALALCLGSLILLLPSGDRQPSGKELFFAGVLAAGVALTMQHLGALWTIAAVLAHFWFPQGQRKRFLLRFALGYAVTALPVALYFIGTVGVATLVQDLIVLPLTRYHNVAGHHSLAFTYMRDLWQALMTSLDAPLTWLNALQTTMLATSFIGLSIVHALPFIGAAALFYLWRSALYPRAVLGLLTVFFAANYITALNRIADTSLVFASPAAVLVLALLMDSVAHRRPVGGRLAGCRRTLTATWIVLFSLLFATEILLNACSPKWATRTAAGTVYSRSFTEYQTLQSLTQLFNQERLQTESVFFYPYTPMLFFLLHADNPTPYDSLVYPLATAEQVDDARSILDAKRCKWIVLSTKLDNNPLLGYLEENYRVARIWPYALVLERREGR